MAGLFNIEVTTSGGLFEGDTEAKIDRWLETVTTSFGKQGLSELSFQMDFFFKNPTPFYETQVIDQRVGESVVIHDRGIVYGPWLEGTGSRNQTTRFRGYHHWRRTFQWLEAEEGPRIIQRHMPELQRAIG